MLGKSEGERLETIVSGIRDNVNVNALIKDKFQLKAVAKQLGLSPGQTRRLLLGETTMSKAMEERVKSAETIKVEDANIALNKFKTSVLEAIGPIGAATISQIKSLELLDSASKVIGGLGGKFGILQKGEIEAIKAGSLPEGLTSFISRTVGIAKRERDAKEVLKDPQGFKANITPAGMVNTSDALQEFSDKLLEVTDNQLNFKELPNLVQAGISLKLFGGIPGMALITPALEAVSRNEEFKEEIGKGIKFIKDFFNTKEKKEKDDRDDDGDVSVPRPGEMTVVTLAPGTKLEITGYSKITDTVIAQVT
jgi:hypothetical protein